MSRASNNPKKGKARAARARPQVQSPLPDLHLPAVPPKPHPVAVVKGGGKAKQIAVLQPPFDPEIDQTESSQIQFEAKILGIGRISLVIAKYLRNIGHIGRR